VALTVLYNTNMGARFSKKDDAVKSTYLDVPLSNYSISFKYYITSLRTKILTDRMIDDAINACKNENGWGSFFKSAFKYTHPNVIAKDIIIKLMKINKNEYNGEVKWTFPTTPYYQLNTEMNIMYPTGVYTIAGQGWAGICFIDSIKELSAD
jgi:hypothetical protein